MSGIAVAVSLPRRIGPQPPASFPHPSPPPKLALTEIRGNPTADVRNVRNKGLDAPEYAEIDRRIRPFLAFRKEELEFHDLLLLSPDGQVIFSLAREKDLGTNLRSGLYKDSPLAQAFDSASLLLTAEISDFVFYPPSKKVAAFIAAPLEREGTVIGVLAAQLDIDGVSAIASDYDGLGQSGESAVYRIEARYGFAGIYLRSLFRCLDFLPIAEDTLG